MTENLIPLLSHDYIIRLSFDLHNYNSWINPMIAAYLLAVGISNDWDIPWLVYPLIFDLYRYTKFHIAVTYVGLDQFFTIDTDTMLSYTMICRIDL